MCCFEQILKATPLKTEALRSLTSHLTSHPSRTNKICGALLKKQRQIPKRCSFMDFYVWMRQCWPTRKDYIQLSEHWMLPRKPTSSYGWYLYHPSLLVGLLDRERKSRNSWLLARFDDDYISHSIKLYIYIYIYDVLHDILHSIKLYIYIYIYIYRYICVYIFVFIYI